MNKIILLICIINTSLYSFGQVGFTEYQLATGLASSRDAQIVDLDLDTDLDIVMVDRGNEANLVWFENLGNGLFSSPIEIFNTGGDFQQKFEKLSVIDLDNDGDLDIATVHVYTGIVVKFVNDGTQNFVKEIIDHAGTFDSWIHTVDISGDGYPEVLSGSVFYDNSFGVFDSVGVYIGTSSYSILSHDFDGDTDEDIVALTPSNEIVMISNDGAGGFGAPQVIDTGLDFGYYWMSLSDLDDDGKMDILYPNSDYFANSSNILKWYKSDGVGGFTVNDLLTVDTNYVVTYLIAADIDNDGDNDLVASMYEGQSYAGTIKCYWNNGSDVFDSSDYQIVTTSIEYTVMMEVADMEGDGDIDILTGAFAFSGGISWFQNQTVPNTGTGVEERLTEWFKIYPSPSSGIVSLAGQLPKEVTIINATGMTILTKALGGKGEIDLSTLPNGIYFLQAESQTQKFVISR